MAGQLSWLEHRTHKPGVGGSNPPPATIKKLVNGYMSKIKNLNKLYRKGVLTKEEFEQAKKKVLE